ncbi:uncharacterized protein LOC133128295 isoform X2 [Conger conger]|uniref:uncharacterized protein LOC133128295 isoform X2 n=1 Tax=Conger conger TaxID=82655 RepID=UPI002A59DCB4|nr:uncharacterized protein LOC133128295 isoform X2 [Conger conger]
MAQWVALSPHSKEVLGSNPRRPGPLCAEFACSPRVCVGFLRVLRFPPTVQRHAGALGREWAVWMPQSIEALSGSCVLIPCRFEMPEYNSYYGSPYDYLLKRYPDSVTGLWRKDRTTVFDSRSQSESHLKGMMTGNLLQKRCTTVLENLPKYYNSPPKPKLTTEKVEVMEGTSVSLSCSAAAPCPKLPPNLTWTPRLSDSVDQLQENEDNTTSVSSDLTFTASHLHHRQKITCRALYTLQQGGNQKMSEASLTLKVQYPPKKTSVSVNPSGSVLEGSSVTLTCSSKASPPVQNYTWYRVNGPEMNTVGTGQNLTFNVTESSGSEQHYCEAQNEHGKENSTAVQLGVNYPPKKTSVSVSPSASVLEGSSVTLTCSSKASPPVQNYIWYRVNGPEMNTVGTGQNLTFNVTESSDSEQYYCEAQNELGKESSTTVLLNVIYMPQISGSGSCSRTAAEISCSCESRGNPSPSMEWHVSGLRVTNSTDRVIREEQLGNTGLRSSLTMRHSQGDTATLLCLSTNALGTSSLQLHDPCPQKHSGVHLQPLLYVIIAALICLNVLTVGFCLHKNKRDMIKVAWLILIGCLLQGALGGEWAVWMPQSIKVLSGSCVLIPCRFDIPSEWEKDLPGTTVQWHREKDDTVMFDSKSQSESHLQGTFTGDLQRKTCTTLLENLPKHARDKYLFRLHDPIKYTFRETFVELIITDSPPQPKLTTEKVEVMEGTSVSLSCSAAAPCPKLPPNLTWTPRLSDSVDQLQENEDKTTSVSSVLTFTASHLHHGQKITCRALYPLQQGGNQTSEASLILTVLYPPKNTSVSVSPSGSVLEGSSVTLTCSSKANPPVQNYTWYRVNGTEMNSVGTGQNLTFNVTESSGSEQYYCEAQNKHGKENSKTVLLNVIYMPQISGSGSCSRTAAEISCSCESRGNPSPSMEWRVSGLRVTNSTDRVIREEQLGNTGLRSSLTMRHSQGDKATLLCLSTNALGTSSLQLHVPSPHSGVSIPSLLIAAAAGAGAMVIVCLIVKAIQKLGGKKGDSQCCESRWKDTEESSPQSEEEPVYANHSMVTTQPRDPQLGGTDPQPLAEDRNKAELENMLYASIKHSPRSVETQGQDAREGAAGHGDDVVYSQVARKKKT